MVVSYIGGVLLFIFVVEIWGYENKSVCSVINIINFVVEFY